MRNELSAEAVRGGLGVAIGLALAACAGCNAGAGGQFVQVRTAGELARNLSAPDRPVMVEFYRNGCTACLMASGPLTNVSNDYAGRAVFLKIEREGTQAVRLRHGIGAYPTVILFTRGRERARWVQMTDAAPYREALDAALAELSGRVSGARHSRARFASL